MTPQSPAVASPPAVFAEAMALLASGLAIVTSRAPDNGPSGLLVASLCSYSAAPPSVLVSVQRDCRSHAALLVAEHFGVHLLRFDQEPAARAFAGPAAHKFDAVEWSWDGDVPAIAGVIAYLRCARAVVFEHADHAVVIGEVTDARVAGGEPLCYLRRRMDWRLEPGR
jgi:flavin reductase (DIM6/NTAB) family NADH-FMN oxidoreductase RutF